METNQDFILVGIFIEKWLNSLYSQAFTLGYLLIFRTTDMNLSAHFCEIQFSLKLALINISRITRLENDTLTFWKCSKNICLLCLCQQLFFALKDIY